MGFLGNIVNSIFGSGGGGGGGGGQTTSTAYNTNIPEYARPYVENMLGATQNQLFNIDESGGITGFKPYQAYGGTYDAQGNQISYDPSKAIAGFSPLQTQAQQGIAGMQTPGEYGTAKGVTSAGIMNAANLGASATPQNFQEQVGGYMNPYMQQVLAPQMAELRRQAGISGVAQQGAATQAGAFGGSREAIMAAENERNLMNAQNQAIGQAYNQAFNAAQNQYNQGQGFQLQANQAALQGAGQLAGLGQQELTAQQGIYGLQNQMGAQQQAQQQAIINQSMQDYANAQQYPLMQLGTMSNMLRGLPMQASTTNQYAAAPSALNQAIGAAGAYGALNKSGAFAASGGLPKEFKMKKMAAGGITSIPRYDVGGAIRADLEEMSLDELKQQVESSSSPRVKQMAKQLMVEKQLAQVPGKAGGGIIAFAKGTTGTVGQDAVEEGKKEAEDAAAAGIVQAAPAAPAGKSGLPVISPYFANYEKEAMQELARLRGEAKQDPKALAEKLEAQAGPNVARQNLMQEEMARRANNADEAERQKQLRLAEFFANWGSTPGSVLVAGMTAFRKTVPGMVEDRKEAKRIQRESDKIIYELEEANRLEKAGYRDKAQTIIQNAAAHAEKINDTVARLKMEQEKTVAQMRDTDVRAAATAESKRQSGEEAKWRTLGAARDNLVHVENAINNQKKAGIYKEAYDLATPYEGKDLSKLDETTRNMVETARQKVKDMDKRHQIMISNAESDVADAYARANPGGKRGETTPAAAPAVELPEGIPKGSKQIGTSGGKPVYEDAKGKRYIIG